MEGFFRGQLEPLAAGAGGVAARWLGRGGRLMAVGRQRHHRFLRAEEEGLGGPEIISLRSGHDLDRLGGWWRRR